MKKRLAALAVVLAIPVLASALGLFARSQWDARWRSGLRREFVLHGQRANARVMDRYALATLCSDSGTAARIPPCRTYNSFSSVILASSVTGGLGLLLVGGVWAAGARARRTRKALVTGFRPVLHGATGALVLLLFVHALLGLQVIRLLSLVGGVRLGGMMAFLGVAALALAFGAASVAVRVARAAGAPRHLLAVPLEPALAGRWRAWLGEPPGDALPVVVGLVPEVFVTAAGAISLDGPLPGASLHVPLTLARILTGPELQALSRRARFRAADEDGAATALTVAWAEVNGGHEALRRVRGLRLLVALPMLSVLTLVLDAFREAEAAFERQQQLAADAAAAEACGAAVCGAAIVKLAAFGPAWLAAVREMREAAREGSQYVSAAWLFADIAAANADRARLSAAIHPDAATAPASVPLRKRLERIGLVPENVVADALDVSPRQNAAGPEAEALAPVEERLTAFVHVQWLRDLAPMA